LEVRRFTRWVTMITNVEPRVTSRVMWSPPPYLPSHLWPPQDLQYSLYCTWLPLSFLTNPFTMQEEQEGRIWCKLPLGNLCNHGCNKRNRDVIWDEVVQYLFFCHFNICDFQNWNRNMSSTKGRRGVLGFKVENLKTWVFQV